MAIFDQTHPKIIELTLSIAEFAPAWKNQFIPSGHFWDTVNFRVLWPDWPNSILTLPTQKFFDQLLVFENLYQHAKNQFIPSVHSSGTVNFRVPSPDLSHPFLIMFTLKIFNHLKICVNLYHHAKNQLILSVLSGDRVNFRVQRPNWSHPYFDHVQPKNLMTRFFNKFKKPSFFFFFFFLKKKHKKFSQFVYITFLWKTQLSYTQLHIGF